MGTGTGRLAGALLLAVALGGCGNTGGFLRDSPSSQRFDFQMSIGGVQYVRSIVGSASAMSVLCIIPVRNDLYERAMREMYGSHQFRPNEVVTNLREDHTTWTGILFCVRKLTVSGEVFEITPAGRSAGTSSRAAPGTSGVPPSVSLPMPPPPGAPKEGSAPAPGAPPAGPAR